jgi:GNAT superfamily N-acetyltransferase
VTPTTTFRRARASDVPAILRIRAAVRENVLSDPSKVTAGMCEQYLEELGRGWVCEIDGRVVAFAYADRAKSSIWALFMEPDFEGRGIGRELLRLATDWLFALGNDVVVLSTNPGTRAEAFYRALGWRLQGMTSDGEVALALPRAGG